MSWQPQFGAWVEDGGTRFRLWAPKADSIEVLLIAEESEEKAYRLQSGDNGLFTNLLPEIELGARYKYRIDGKEIFPDPASRFQPEGVHGPSQVVDARQFSWSDDSWQGIPRDDLVIYELHVGTFTPEGTYQGIIEKLPYLVDLGVTAIELMPVADFPGNRNWGYDGVSLFAPARCYGTPDDLRRLVDAAHQKGLAVLLDVVYNHIGPDGNYLGVYTPYFDSPHHRSPWGAGMNFDGEQSQMVREYFINNAIYWLHDFHFDGLRLDATHAIVDNSPQHFLAELTSRVKASGFQRRIHLIAEDHRNLAHMVQPVDTGGWGLDGVWADDFHHQTRRLLAGDREGYYRDFSDTPQDLATTVEQGWFYSGQYSHHLNEPRGSDPNNLSLRDFVICIQNHDQIGNRAFGERLNHQVDLAAFRAATALLLCSPETPLMFMGQEWAASTPFCFFTDHNEELGKLVTNGRRQEFRHFAAFADPTVQEKIPDPQADATFLNCRLKWDELESPGHSHLLQLYKTLLELRKQDPTLQATERKDCLCFAANDKAIVLERRCQGHPTLLLVCQLRGFGSVDLEQSPRGFQRNRKWQVLLTTENPFFAAEPKVPVVCWKEQAPLLYFFRPSAALLKEVI